MLCVCNAGDPGSPKAPLLTLRYSRLERMQQNALWRESEAFAKFWNQLEELGWGVGRTPHYLPSSLLFSRPLDLMESLPLQFPGLPLALLLLLPFEVIQHGGYVVRQ